LSLYNVHVYLNELVLNTCTELSMETCTNVAVLD